MMHKCCFSYLFILFALTIDLLDHNEIFSLLQRCLKLLSLLLTTPLFFITQGSFFGRGLTRLLLDFIYFLLFLYLFVFAQLSPRKDEIRQFLFLFWLQVVGGVTLIRCLLPNQRRFMGQKRRNYLLKLIFFLNFFALLPRLVLVCKFLLRGVEEEDFRGINFGLNMKSYFGRRNNYLFFQVIDRLFILIEFEPLPWQLLQQVILLVILLHYHLIVSLALTSWDRLFLFFLLLQLELSLVFHLLLL